MPFHIRKSVSAGPFRFNFSNGGVGASVGVKGLRIGTGPRGHYVHAGRGGVHYRATIGCPGDRRAPAPVAERPATRPAGWHESGVDMVEVESGDVLAMRDETARELIDEINAKRQQPSMALMLCWPPILLGVVLALMIGPAALFVAFLGLAGLGLGSWVDSYRRTCVVFYDLDPDVAAGYERAVRCFEAMASCAGKWHVEAGGVVRDLTTWKRNAGASRIVRKKPTSLVHRLPATVASNITPPAMQVGRQTIFFLPDVALVDDGRRVGAVGYGSLSIAWQDSNFIEDGAVPRDAQVIGRTWKHPNKNGGPDRRFRDNRQIPICRYEAMHLSSGTGVNELVEFSRSGVVAPFAKALEALPRRTLASAARPRLSAP